MKMIAVKEAIFPFTFFRYTTGMIQNHRASPARQKINLENVFGTLLKYLIVHSTLKI